VSLRVHILCLAIATALTLPTAYPSADTGSGPQPRLEIVRAATARIVFREGQHMALFTGAELAYGELTLIAERIEHNSLEQTVTLSGAARLHTPEYTLNTAECSVDLATGHVSADSGLELINSAEGVTLTAERGSFWAEPAGNRVLRAELAGGIIAQWDKGITLQGGLLESDFVRREHFLAGDFTGTVSPALLPPPLSKLSGGELILAGRDLTARLEEGMPERFHVAASAVRIDGEKLGLCGPDLKARLTLADDGEPLAENGMLRLSGPAGEPVSGWLLDEQGERVSFSAQSIEKAAGSNELVLKKDVLVTGPDFSLRAQAVSVFQEEQGFRVTIPQRFRVVISPKALQMRSSLSDRSKDA